MTADLHHALSLAILATFAAKTAATDRATPAQRDQLTAALDGGAAIVFCVRLTGGVAQVEIGVAPHDVGPLFEQPLMRFSGPAVAALAPPDSVTVTDRAKLN